MIAPETTLGVGRTESDPKKLRELYEEGYRIGREKNEKTEKISGVSGFIENRQLRNS